MMESIKMEQSSFIYSEHDDVDSLFNTHLLLPTLSADLNSSNSQEALNLTLDSLSNDLFLPTSSLFASLSSNDFDLNFSDSSSNALLNSKHNDNLNFLSDHRSSMKQIEQANTSPTPSPSSTSSSLSLSIDINSSNFFVLNNYSNQNNSMDHLFLDIYTKRLSFFHFFLLLC